MALNVTNIANYLFKKLQGKSSTLDGKQYFEESRNGRPAVFQNQIVSQSDLIPTTAPGGLDQVITGVVKRWIDLVLRPVPGVSNAFFSDNLIGAIPFNFGDGSYNYVLKDSTGATIPFGLGDWLLDGDTGVITFVTSTPANMPPKVSFYQYIGNYGAVQANPPYLQLARQMTTPATPPAGFDRIYIDSTGKPLKVDPLGAIKALGGSGGGAGGKNYLADLYDGTSLTGIVPFDAAPQLIINGSSNPVDTLGDAINATNHSFGTGQQVLYTATFGAIGGLTSNTIYFVVRLNANLFGLATTLQNAASKVLIDLTSQGTNTQSFSLATPSFASGSSAALPTGVTTSLNTTLPLRSPSNQRLSRDANNRAGRGWSIDYPLDRVDTDGGKLMKLAFKYRTSAAYPSGDVAFHLLDLTSGLLMPMDGNLQTPLTASTTATGFIAYFTPNQGSTNYRLVITIQNTNTVAYDIDVMDLEISSASGMASSFFGTPTVNAGPLIIGAITTAPTKGNVLLDNVWVRRVGEFAHIRIEYNQSTAGGAGSGDYLFTLPQGLQADLAKLTAYNTPINGAAPFSTVNDIGGASVRVSGTNHFIGGRVIMYDATRFRISGVTINMSNSTSLNGGMLGSAFGGFNNAAYSMSALIEVPILGWGTSATYSTAEVALKNQPISAVSAEYASTPAASAFLPLTGNYLDLPIGQHDLSGVITFFNNGTSAAYTQLRATWCGSNGTSNTTSPVALASLPGVTVLGNVDISKRVSVDYETLAAPNITVICKQLTRVFLVPFATSSSGGNMRTTAYLQASKRPDYSAFGVYQQSVVWSGYVPSNTAITSTTNIPFTSSKDSHGCWNGTGFVVKFPGDYQTGGTLVIGASANTLQAFVNGVVARPLALQPAAANNRMTANGLLINLKVNDVVTFRSDGNLTVLGSTIDNLFLIRLPGV